MSPTHLYGDGLLTAAAGAGAASWVRYADRPTPGLDLQRWTGPAAGADEGLLAR